MSDDRIPLAPLPSTTAQLGAGLRAFRTVGLRQLAARQAPGPGALVISKSQLQRYETGETLPPLEYAEHLDALYQAGGWALLGLRSLYGATWDPWSSEHGDASMSHAHGWPAGYRGMVWIALKPLPHHVGREHALSLDWGPWRMRLTLTIGAPGYTITTGKSIDESGDSATLNLDSDLPLFTLGGAGPTPPSSPAVDVRLRWRYGDVAAPSARKILRRRILAGVMRRPL